MNDNVVELLHELNTKTRNMDMAHALLEEVIERTGNFREGYYSMKLVRDLQRAAAKDATLLSSLGTESMPEMVRRAIQNYENIQATIMTEIDRIDN